MFKGKFPHDVVHLNSASPPHTPTPKEQIPHLPKVWKQSGLSKQCKPRSDTADQGLQYLPLIQQVLDTSTIRHVKF